MGFGRAPDPPGLIAGRQPAPGNPGPNGGGDRRAGGLGAAQSSGLEEEAGFVHWGVPGGPGVGGRPRAYSSVPGTSAKRGSFQPDRIALHGS
jgi:hypothetical protein